MFFCRSIYLVTIKFIFSWCAHCALLNIFIYIQNNIEYLFICPVTRVMAMHCNIPLPHIQCILYTYSLNVFWLRCVCSFKLTYSIDAIQKPTGHFTIVKNSHFFHCTSTLPNCIICYLGTTSNQLTTVFMFGSINRHLAEKSLFSLCCSLKRTNLF